MSKAQFVENSQWQACSNNRFANCKERAYSKGFKSYVSSVIDVENAIILFGVGAETLVRRLYICRHRRNKSNIQYANRIYIQVWFCKRGFL